MTLTAAGEVDYEKIGNKLLAQSVRKQEALVRMTLMQADIGFEYP